VVFWRPHSTSAAFVVASVLSLKSLNAIHVTGLHRGEASREVSLAQRSFSSSFSPSSSSSFFFLSSPLSRKSKMLLELCRFNDFKDFFHLAPSKCNGRSFQVCSQSIRRLSSKETTGIRRMLRDAACPLMCNHLLQSRG